MTCRSLFVLLYFFFWPLCCLFFLDMRFLIVRLISSNSFSSKLFSETLEFLIDNIFVMFGWRFSTDSRHTYGYIWPKEKVQKDKQRSTSHTYKTKYRVTRIPRKSGGELMCSGRESSSCSTSGTHRVNLVTNPVISREWGLITSKMLRSSPWLGWP
jgi:hypothetical protein